MGHAPTILADLENFLKREDITLTQFAESCGLQTGTLSNLRNGHRPISVWQLDQITMCMGHQEGYYYDLYIDNYIIDRSPDWRRIGPLLLRCAEMDKLDAIRRVVQHIMDKLMYSPLLFETAEELFAQGRYAAAMPLYESIAEGEGFQHSERLALCQYRLFTLKLGDDQGQNLQTALQFEPFVKRLDEIDQLDGLKNLANAYRSLRRWDKVLRVAEELGELARIQYSLPRSPAKEGYKQPSRPWFFYVAYSKLLIGGAYHDQENYNMALQMANEYAQLDWVKETDPETLHWKGLFQEWAEANIYLARLMSGDIELLAEYVDYIKPKEIEIIRGLWNIIRVANCYTVDVDHILIQFEAEISSIHEQEGNEIYNQQNTADQFIGLQYELAYYYLFKKNYEIGFRHLMDGMEKSTIINNESSILRYMRLFERFRDFASAKFISEYHNLLVEEGGNHDAKGCSAVRC